MVESETHLLPTVCLASSSAEKAGELLMKLVGSMCVILTLRFFRVLQLTAETIGRAEKTEYDVGFEVLSQRTDYIKG